MFESCCASFLLENLLSSNNVAAVILVRVELLSCSELSSFAAFLSSVESALSRLGKPVPESGFVFELPGGSCR